MEKTTTQLRKRIIELLNKNAILEEKVRDKDRDLNKLHEEMRFIINRPDAALIRGIEKERFAHSCNLS